MIYFDNAATSGKKPQGVITAVKNAMLCLSANPGRSGHYLSIKAAEKIYETRQKTACFFGASAPENVVFTANCTESLNFIIKGVLKRGDRVVVSDFEHNAVMRPLTKIGADITEFKVSLNDDNETMENFKSVISEDIKMVICSGASNVLGKKVPIEKIGEICRKMGILFAVDGAQIAGHQKIDMQNMCIDYLAIAPHKGLYAPMGVGILIAEKNINDTIIEGGTGTESNNFNQPQMMPEMLESGTVNLPAILGIFAGIDFIEKAGIDNIGKKEHLIINRIYAGLKENKKAVLYTDEPNPSLYAPVLSFNLKDISSLDAAYLLDKKGIALRAGLHCAVTAHRKIGTEDIGTIRVSPSCFNDLSEAEYFLKAVEKI